MVNDLVALPIREPAQLQNYDLMCQSLAKNNDPRLSLADSPATLPGSLWYISLYVLPAK